MSISKPEWLKKILVCVLIIMVELMILNQNLPLSLDINISEVKANGHGYQKTVDLSEQLTSCA